MCFRPLDLGVLGLGSCEVDGADDSGSRLEGILSNLARDLVVIIFASCELPAIISFDANGSQGCCDDNGDGADAHDYDCHDGGNSRECDKFSYEL